jgi:hypothetical protein
MSTNPTINYTSPYGPPPPDPPKGDGGKKKKKLDRRSKKKSEEVSSLQTHKPHDFMISPSLSFVYFLEPLHIPIY